MWTLSLCMFNKLHSELVMWTLYACLKKIPELVSWTLYTCLMKIFRVSHVDPSTTDEKYSEFVMWTLYD